ncbi:MAG TPA: hypothetical protein VFZ97_17480 [Acidimicrobiales bacterium]
MPKLAASNSKKILAPVAVGLSCAIGLAACGGGSSSAAGSSSTTTVPGAGAETFPRYTQCLESHGVPSSVAGAFAQRRGLTQNPTSPPSGGFTRPTIPAEYQAAFQACRTLRPNFGAGLNSAAFAAYRNCLQLHGVSIPTPTTAPGQTSGQEPSGGGPRGAFSQLQNSPTFKAAQQACAALLPNRGSTTTTTTPAAS